MKRNELKEIVDRELSGLTWDEGKSRRVLDALDDRGFLPALPARRKFSLVLAMAILLTLLATTALAVTLIRYAPRVNDEARARQLLISEYGLSRESLGLFQSDVEEKNGVVTVTFRATEWSDDLTGVYTVTFRGDQATASWSTTPLTRRCGRTATSLRPSGARRSSPPTWWRGQCTTPPSPT